MATPRQRRNEARTCQVNTVLGQTIYHDFTLPASLGEVSPPAPPPQPPHLLLSLRSGSGSARPLFHHAPVYPKTVTGPSRRSYEP